MTSGRDLEGVRVLVAEDEWFVAMDVASCLRDLSAEVLGPVPTARETIALASDGMPPDLALLDVSLRDGDVFAAADALRARGIPIIFATGLTPGTLPPRFADATCWEKPFSAEALVRAVVLLLRLPP